MAETYTVTKAKYAGEKENPHGGKLHKFYCSFVDESGNGESDVYWQRKSEESPEGEQFFGRIEKGEFGLRFYTEQQQNGSQPRSGGSSGGFKSDPERSRRIERQHSQDMALRALADMTHVSGTEDFRAEIKDWTDWFQADLDADGGGVPSPRLAGESQRPAATVSAPTGFASDKQKGFFERLLKQASLDSNQVAGVVRFTEQLATERVSKAIDGLNDNDTELAERTVAALLREADAWARLQSDVPWEDA